MNESNYFIDTNIFLRVLTKDDEKVFKNCVAFLEKVKIGKIKAETSPLVLAEVNWVLSRIYEFPKPQIISAIRSIIALNNLKIKDKSNVSEALNLYETTNVKFIDTLIASHPQIINKKIIVISYDRDFDKLGCLREEP